MTITEQTAILSNYELLKKDEDRYNKNSFEIRKLASTWLLTTSAGISYLISQYKPDKPISLNPPPLIISQLNFLIVPPLSSNELIALVALLGLIGLTTLAIIDRFLYLQLLKATVLVSKEIEQQFPDTLVDLRTRVINKIRNDQHRQFSIVTVASSLFYLIPICLLIIVMYFFSWLFSVIGMLFFIGLLVIELKFLPIANLTSSTPEG